METPRTHGFVRSTEVAHIDDRLAADLQSCLANAFPAVAWIRKTLNGPIEFAIDAVELTPSDADSIRTLLKTDRLLCDWQHRFAVGEILFNRRRYILISVAQ